MADRLLDTLSRTLPEGWSLVLTGDTLTIARREPVWVLSENRINAPMSRETADERSRRIRAHGERSACRLVYRLDERWTDGQLADVRAANAEIDSSVAALYAAFPNVSTSRKGDDSFKTQNADDERRVQAFMKQRDALLARRRPLPDLHSERHSLFLVAREGGEDGMHFVDPPDALAAAERVVRELLGGR
jgi:hypothetical protein